MKFPPHALLSHCGYWNSEGNHRCTHCGRRFELVDGVSAVVARGSKSSGKPDSPRPLPAPQAAPAPGGRGLAGRFSTAQRRRGGVPAASAAAAAKPGVCGRRDVSAAPLLPLRPRSAKTSRAAAAQAAPLKRRALACFLDGILIAAAGAIFVFGFTGLKTYLRPDSAAEIGVKTAAFVFFILLCFYWSIFIYFTGRTQGMQWARLEIAALDGTEPTDSQRLMRILGTIVSTVSFGIGFAWAFIDERKLTFHDNMSKTVIVESSR